MLKKRSEIGVYSVEGKKRLGTIKLPSIFQTPLRPDLVRDVVNMMRMNKRQPHAVKVGAGYGTSAESWGTGRAVARIPRVPGSGTHAADQGAFGNMCRGGGMFAPLKIWRRWHRKINLKEKRFSVISAITGTAIPALCQASGHLIDSLPEFPLVIDDSLECLNKNKIGN